MKIYLAGPMDGYEEHNVPAFNKWAKFLRDKGNEVFSPAECEFNDNFVPSGKECRAIREIFEVELTWICRNAEAIAMMPGWEKSKGAQAEWALARVLGLTFVYLT